jgi:hypothetical protein
MPPQPPRAMTAATPNPANSLANSLDMAHS